MVKNKYLHKTSTNIYSREHKVRDKSQDKFEEFISNQAFDSIVLKK